MKNKILIALMVLAGSCYGAAELCPGDSPSGSDGCLEVDEVLIFGEWFTACCANIETPDGYSCVDDDCFAKRKSTNIPELTKENAYVLFASGYRTWAIFAGEVDQNVSVNGFDMETIRAYLPFARLLFLSNPKINKFSLKHSDDIKIVIERPVKEEDLKEEVIIPNFETDAKEVEKYLKQVDAGLLRIFPNPGVDVVQVYFENNVPIANVTILSNDGTVVKTFEFSEAVLKAKISISDLDPQTYIIKITDKYEREFSEKLVKK